MVLGYWHPVTTQAVDAQAQPGVGGVDEGSALLSAYEQEEALIDAGSSNGNSSPGARMHDRVL